MNTEVRAYTTMLNVYTVVNFVIIVMQLMGEERKRTCLDFNFLNQKFWAGYVAESSRRSLTAFMRRLLNLYTIHVFEAFDGD